MITLTNQSGRPISVNPMVIFAIEQEGAATKILSAAGHAVWVTEDFAEVEKRVKAWTKG